MPIFSGDTLERLYPACCGVSYDATGEAARKLRDGLEDPYLDNEGLQPSYYSPGDEDWREFRGRGRQVHLD